MGEGLTAADTKRWLLAEAAACCGDRILEWTHDKHLRHPKLIALRAQELLEKSHESSGNDHLVA